MVSSANANFPTIPAVAMNGLTCDRSWMFHIRSLSGCSDSLWSGSKWWIKVQERNMAIMDWVIGGNGQGYWWYWTGLLLVMNRVIGGNGQGYC